MLGSLTIPLFPLNTVLLRGSYLPLHIFEPRYLRMIRHCQESEIGFGVVLIRDGNEVHSAKDDGLPDIYSVGTLAEIENVEELPNDRLAVITVGGAKFQIEASWEEDDHLMMGEVTFAPDEPRSEVGDNDRDLVDLLESVMDATGVPLSIKDKIDLNDTRDIGLRLADYLPFDVADKQKLLQIDSPSVRLTTIRSWCDF